MNYLIVKTGTRFRLSKKVCLLAVCKIHNLYKYEYVVLVQVNIVKISHENSPA